MKKQVLYPSIVSRLFSTGVDMLVISILIIPFETNFDHFVFSMIYSNELVTEIQPYSEFIKKVPQSLTMIYITYKFLFIFFFMGAYFVSSWYYFSLTIGKFLTKQAVISTNGGRIPFIKCVIRYIFCILLPINLILIALLKSKQGVHDMLASTIVIKS